MPLLWTNLYLCAFFHACKMIEGQKGEKTQRTVSADW